MHDLFRSFLVDGEDLLTVSSQGNHSSGSQSSSVHPEFTPPSGFLLRVGSGGGGGGSALGSGSSSGSRFGGIGGGGGYDANGSLGGMRRRANTSPECDDKVTGPIPASTQVRRRSLRPGGWLCFCCAGVWVCWCVSVDRAVDGVRQLSTVLSMRVAELFFPHVLVCVSLEAICLSLVKPKKTRPSTTGKRIPVRSPASPLTVALSVIFPESSGAAAAAACCLDRTTWPVRLGVGAPLFFVQGLRITDVPFRPISPSHSNRSPMGMLPALVGSPPRREARRTTIGGGGGASNNNMHARSASVSGGGGGVTPFSPGYFLGVHNGGSGSPAGGVSSGEFHPAGSLQLSSPWSSLHQHQHHQQHQQQQQCYGGGGGGGTSATAGNFGAAVTAYNSSPGVLQHEGGGAGVPAPSPSPSGAAMHVPVSRGLAGAGGAGGAGAGVEIAKIVDFSPTWDYAPGGAKLLICLAAPVDVEVGTPGPKVYFADRAVPVSRHPVLRVLVLSASQCVSRLLVVLG